MNKVLKGLLAVLLGVSLAGCSNNGTAGTDEPETTDETQTIEVDEGLINVTITLPASFFEMMETTPEEYVSSQAEEARFKETKLNDDGSVDITMSKKDYKDLMSGLSESIDNSLQELVDDTENYPNIIGVKVNDDYSKFTVTVDSGEVTMMDGFTAILFYYLGGMYQMFGGSKTPQVIVEYVNKDGDVIETANSDGFYEKE